MEQPRKRKNLKVRVSKEDIEIALRKLGLKKGDIVGVHISLNSFGYVKGGADAVIDALLDTVGREGTIVMPTHSTNRIKVELTSEEVTAGVCGYIKSCPLAQKRLLVQLV